MAEDQIEFLKEYNEWIEQRKRISRDLTPEAFLVDRAKDEALDRLIEIEELLERYTEYSSWAGEDQEWINKCDDMLTEIRMIIKGDDS